MEWKFKTMITSRSFKSIYMLYFIYQLAISSHLAKKNLYIKMTKTKFISLSHDIMHLVCDFVFVISPFYTTLF